MGTKKKKRKKRKAQSVEGQKILQVETIFYFIYLFFSRIVSILQCREEGRMVWWIKVEVLLTVQSVGPCFCPAADILCNPKQVITSRCPSSSSLKMGAKPCLLALSRKGTQFVASLSQSLEGSGREGKKMHRDAKLPAGNAGAAAYPARGELLLLPAQCPEVQPALRQASRGSAMCLWFWQLCSAR